MNSTFRLPISLCELHREPQLWTFTMQTSEGTSDEFQRTSFSGKANDNLLFRRRQWEKIVEEQYRLFVIQHTAKKSGNQQVMQLRILKGKMNKERLTCTAMSTTDDITGTMAHYLHMEERQAKNGQIWRHQKFCEDPKTKKKKDAHRNGNTDTSNRKEKIWDKPKRPTGKMRHNYSGTETKIMFHMLQVREENVGLLLNVGRKLVTDGTEKTEVYDAFFASVFIKRLQADAWE